MKKILLTTLVGLSLNSFAAPTLPTRLVCDVKSSGGITGAKEIEGVRPLNDGPSLGRISVV